MACTSTWTTFQLITRAPGKPARRSFPISKTLLSETAITAWKTRRGIAGCSPSTLATSPPQTGAPPAALPLPGRPDREFACAPGSSHSAACESSARVGELLHRPVVSVLRYETVSVEAEHGDPRQRFVV